MEKRYLSEGSIRFSEHLSPSTGRTRTGSRELIWMLRDFHEARGVVTLRSKPSKDAIVRRGGKGFLPGHYPAIITGGMSDRHPAILRVEINDQIGCADEWQEMDAPFGVRPAVGDFRDEIRALLGGAETFFPVAKPIGNSAVRAERITFNRIDISPLGKVGDVRDYPPITHVSGQIDVSHGLKRRLVRPRSAARERQGDAGACQEKGSAERHFGNGAGASGEARCRGRAVIVRETRPGGMKDVVSPRLFPSLCDDFYCPCPIGHDQL